MRPHPICNYNDLTKLKPLYAFVEGVDLVVILYEKTGVSVLYGRCLHRGALLSDGYVEGENIVCGLHGWDYRYKTGVSEYNNKEALYKFVSWIDEGKVWVDAEEIKKWTKKNPQPYKRDKYLGNYADVHGTEDEPYNKEIQYLAEYGLKPPSHGQIQSMGVSRNCLPSWDDILIQTAQLHTRPQTENVVVNTKLVLGPKAKNPLKLDIPLIISDMSFGALSLEAKVALSMGANRVGTGICSGEGGMLPEEQQANKRYLYELATAKFGFDLKLMKNVQAFHFKAGQAAKTGLGGHLPGHKVQGRIAQIRNLEVGKSAISPPTFSDLKIPSDFRKLADKVREVSGGIPIGFKISANHIEDSIQFALDVGVDYIILDGRGGGTGASPTILRNHISIPTIPALARARAYLNKKKMGPDDITLLITGGLRTAPDFVKALCLGADGIALANSAMQAIGCLGMRACATNNCPVGIATQKDNLRKRLSIEKSAQQLANFLNGSIHLMSILSRACGHGSLNAFSTHDIVTCKREMYYLTGIPYAGMIM